MDLKVIVVVSEVRGSLAEISELAKSVCVCVRVCVCVCVCVPTSRFLPLFL